MADVASLVNGVSELVRIPSVNPLQSDDAALNGERRLAEHLANKASDLGAEVELDNVVDDRPNLIAKFEGERPDTVVIDVHLDTVAVSHMTDDPFDGRVENDRVYGRGSVDTKATFAIVLDVLSQLKQEGRRPGPTVHLVGTVSEEMGGLLGARHLANRLQHDGHDVARMVIAEPTLCAPVHGHKGGVGLEICVHGHAAHSSRPELGANAISAAARIIAALDAEQARLEQTEAATAVGRGTLSVTEIGGGVARNIIPDLCTLYAGRRIAPGEDPLAIYESLRDLVITAGAPLQVDVEMANGTAFPAFFTDPNDDFVQLIASLSERMPETVTYGSNCLAYDDLDASKVLFGPGSIDQAHQAVEWVDIDELVRAASVYRKLFAA
ncbi:MAG: M20/M25/M40 family metallo-hydrolase [Ilumatobacteraceae bacterium]|nr:M20 family peptidase [Actinomycetota bacterium]